MKNNLLKKRSMLFVLMTFLAMSYSMNAQYCEPEGTNPDRYINNFSTTLGSENISNLETGFSTDGYGDFYDTQTVAQATLESVTFSVDIEGGSAGFRIWVDWNQDDVFDAVDEVVYMSDGYRSNHTGTIVVPADAVEGETRMRIVSHWLSNSGDVDPCEMEFSYGEFEDYKFNVLIPQECDGTPEAGTAMVDPTSGNAGSNYTVSAQDYTVAAEMSFQWQSNTNGEGWEDQGSATANHTPYTATAPSELGDVVDWRLALTCTASGETSLSEVASFTVVIRYCEITATNVEPITKVVFAGIDNDSSPLTSSDGYEDFTNLVAQVETGETYSFAAEGNTNGPYTAFFTVWIDWNQNGDFEADEIYEIGSIQDSDGTDGQQAINDILVPTDALSGETRMRIIKNYNSSRIDPCGSVTFGQTEDYTVNVGGGGGTFPSPYCAIEDAGDVLVEAITAVEFADASITNEDDTSVLIDKTDIVANVMQDETYTISVEGNTEGDFENNIVAFIDWNQNGVLDDAGEIYELGTLENSTGDDGVSVSMDITVPADAVVGPTRIRITKTYFDEDSDPLINPCGIQFDPWGMGTTPGFGQALDFTLEVEESLGMDCGQGDDSNEFENGLNVTAGSPFRNADDFAVSANNTLNVKSIEFNLLANEPVTSLDINFYNDDNGAPGSTIVETVTAVVPYAQVMIGTAFGFNAYAVFVEVDLNFEGGTAGETYWMQPAAESAGAFWEVSTVGTLGAPIHSSEDGAAWVPDEDGSQGVFKLHCDVATPPDQECFFDITATVEPMTRMIMANVDNASSVDSTEALEDFTGIVITAEAGESYDVAMEGNTGGGFTNYFTVFVNTTLDNDWSSYETYEIGSINGSTGTDGKQATANITLPTDLQEGEYLLRVVKNFNTSPLDPCSSYSYGQGEDYTLLIGALDDCTGTPDAGVAAVDPEVGNPNSSYTVSAADYGFANGITYQWQSNTDGAGWEDQGDLMDQYSSFEATAPAEDGIEVEWRLEVTCTLSQETSYSETAIFTTETSTGVYCIPELDCADGDMITNVTFEGIDNTTTCSPAGYGDYTAMTAIVQAGGTYPISVSVGDGWAYESVSVWIDFDDNGTFDEEEFFYIGTGSDEALTGEIAVPAGVANGDYRMRVRVAADGEANTTWDLACDEEQGFGETEDYTVTVDGVVGMDDNATANFTYYPNPVNEVLYLTADTDIESISVYNVLGQQVLSNKHFADGKVDVSSLSSGTFMFQVTFKSGDVENFKVLKN